MKLYLDVGNSRFKWIQQGQDLATVASSLSALKSQWQSIKTDISEIIACSVGKKQTKLQIDTLAKKLFGRHVCWQETSAEGFGVENAYAKPADLGVDRWVALIAARALCPDTACVVVDAGTAITVDLLDEDGRHVGGVIMAGKMMLVNAISNAEQLQGEFSSDVKRANAVCQSTKEAVASGIYFSINGGVRAVIEQQVAQINAKINAVPILVTGGDADMIFLDAANLKFMPNLVLDGLHIIGMEK